MPFLNYKTLCIFLLLGLNSNSITAQKNKIEPVYSIVDEMPYLKSCDDAFKTYKEKKRCSDSALLDHLFSHLTLDSTDLYYSICCNAMVSFVITKDGSIEQIQILKSLNSGFDNRLIAIIKASPPWVPGKLRGEKVAVKIQLPIKIKPNPKW